MDNTTKDRLRGLLAALLATVMVSIIVNTPLYIASIWWVVDIAVPVIAIVFTLLARRSPNGYWPLVILMWLPVLVVVYMATQGLLSVKHPVWLVQNMCQLALYGYVLGAMSTNRLTF